MSTIRAATVANLAGTGPTQILGTVPVTARATINMATPALLGSFNVSSLADLGVGSPQLNLTNTIASRTECAVTTTCAIFSNGFQYGVQSGGKIQTTSTVDGFFSGDTTGRSDWHEGTMSVIGDLA